MKLLGLISKTFARIKVVIISVSLTLLAVLIVAKFFLTSVLGLFDLVPVPKLAYQKLIGSQKVVEKLQKKHKIKKVKFKKKFVANSGKKLVTAGVSASTIGTIAVLGSLSYLEAKEYCEERKELIKVENILFGTEVPFNESSCYDGIKTDMGHVFKNSWAEVKANGSSIFEDIFNYTDEILKPSREATTEFFEYMAPIK